MTYAPRHYATAFMAAIADGAAEDDAARGLVRALTKNADLARAGRVVREVEKRVVSRAGGRRIAVECARTPGPAARRALEALFSAHDIVSFVENPSLIAGVRITIDEAREIDASFSRLLGALFPPHGIRHR